MDNWKVRPLAGLITLVLLIAAVMAISFVSLSEGGDGNQSVTTVVEVEAEAGIVINTAPLSVADTEIVAIENQIKVDTPTKTAGFGILTGLLSLAIMVIARFQGTADRKRIKQSMFSRLRHSLTTITDSVINVARRTKKGVMASARTINNTVRGDGGITLDPAHAEPATA